MTANELADKLMESNSVSWGSCTHEQHDNDKYFKEQASAMLRQQQAEIEALKLRELTDEEINEVFKSIYGHNNSYINSSLFNFARAILRKASEK
jgi:hypothetical protein